MVPPALLAAFLACDARMYGFVLRRRGLPSLLGFAGLHFLVNVTITAGVATGAAQWLLSRTFRQLYDASFPVGGTPPRWESA
ncbi:hypothetical protein RM555_08980 [Micromonospora sp. DSM 115977]|uniref:Uncharacterized protein n=1 Tax=Micromonospora reichwaldensis TaxID=3075516 RepID=A0ABU2WT78_9ACTN|nr:hypothetical protein [Micromonospora sp. DSM 115977]MDT0529128.1 hypothetical protein [Micromonospora sp. DSM 115977]